MNNYTSKPVSLAQREEGLGESDRVLYISLCFQWLLEDKGVCADPGGLDNTIDEQSRFNIESNGNKYLSTHKSGTRGRVYKEKYWGFLQFNGEIKA